METLILTLSLFLSNPSGSDLVSSNIVNTVVSEIPSYQTKTQERASTVIPVATRIAKELNIKPELVVSVIWTESHFKSSAKSHVGASGLMQIMPTTKKALIKEMKDFNVILTSNLNSGLSYHELESIILGSYYLDKLMKRFNSEKEAIIAYNMGPTWVSKKKANNEPFGYDHDYFKKVSSKMELIASAY